MLLKVGTQVSNALKITLTKFHQHLSCGSQVFKGWHTHTNNSLHDRRGQKTISIKKKNTTIRTIGRHDPCVGIRCVPVAEAMVAIVLADHFLRNKTQKKI